MSATLVWDPSWGPVSRRWRRRSPGLLVLFSALVLMGAGGSYGQSGSASQQQGGGVTGHQLYNSVRTDVRAYESKNHQVEEYRASGNTYMLKVKPKNAPAYYLVDEDGSGDLEWRRRGVQAPQWAVKKW